MSGISPLRIAALSPVPLTFNDEGLGQSIAEPTARDLRRARLVAFIARRRFRYLALHLALGVMGWALLGAAIWGVSVALG